MEIVASYCTDVGTRKKINQDSICLKSLQCGDISITMAVVCDGMGGLQQGEIASSSLTEAFSQWFDNDLRRLLAEGFSFGIIRQQWQEIVLGINNSLIEYGRKEGKKLGTTVTAMLMVDDKGMFVLHVGDCRLYQIKDKIEMLTEDQTFVQLQVNKGILTKEQAKVDPRQNIILQCIGDSDNVNLDMQLHTVKHDCTYMLCSDGFRHKISEEDMCQYLSPLELSTKEKVDRNTSYLVELCKERKEQDNISVIVIRTL